MFLEVVCNIASSSDPLNVLGPDAERPQCNCLRHEGLVRSSLQDIATIPLCQSPLDVVVICGNQLVTGLSTTRSTRCRRAPHPWSRHYIPSLGLDLVND